MLASKLEEENEIQELDEDILSTQEIPLGEIQEVEESTDEIDLMSMFSTGNTGELELSGIKEDESLLPNLSEILNLLLQADKNIMLQNKDLLAGIARYAIDAQTSSFVALLEKTKVISSGERFILLASEDTHVISQVNKLRKTQAFIDFVSKVFKTATLVFAITKEQFIDVKKMWADLSTRGELPQPKPIEKVEISQELETPEEIFGKEIFGDLFSK